MKKSERIEALEIASKYEIKVVLSWWNPMSNVAWSVLKSRKKLSPEQYGYLSNNKLIKLKREITKGKEVILQISELGKQKLAQLQNKPQNIASFADFLKHKDADLIKAVGEKDWLE